MVNLYDLAASLNKYAITDEGPLHVRAFSAWLRADNETLRGLVEAATAAEQQRHPEHVAVLGYAHGAALLTADEEQILSEDLTHLSGRSFFVSGRPPRFEIDGIALLGVALAFFPRKGVEAAQWLLTLLDRSAQEVAADDWSLGLVNGAQLVLREGSYPVGVPDLAIALASKGIGGPPPNLDEAWHVAADLRAPESVDRAAVRLCALEDLMARASQIVPRTATRDDLITILRGTGRSLKRWPYGNQTPQSKPALWEIDNEYNVQDMLWAILAPVFPDLEDEENLPSLGPKHPRVDLGIPRLRTIIEVKYLRNNRQADRAKIIEEIAADASLYLAKATAYDSIVAYIWDDASQTEQHHEIEMGLESIRGIIGVVIVPRPAKMDRARG